MDISHSEIDGASGYGYLLKKNGYIVSSLPKFKGNTSISLIAKIIAYVKFMKMSLKKHQVPWQKYNPEKRLPGCGVIFNKNALNYWDSFL